MTFRFKKDHKKKFIPSKISPPPLLSGLIFKNRIKLDSVCFNERWKDGGQNTSIEQMAELKFTMQSTRDKRTFNKTGESLNGGCLIDFSSFLYFSYFYFFLTKYGRKNFLLGSNFRNRNFDGFIRFKTPWIRKFVFNV